MRQLQLLLMVAPFQMSQAWRHKFPRDLATRFDEDGPSTTFDLKNGLEKQGKGFVHKLTSTQPQFSSQGDQSFTPSLGQGCFKTHGDLLCPAYLPHIFGTEKT